MNVMRIRRFREALKLLPSWVAHGASITSHSRIWTRALEHAHASVFGNPAVRLQRKLHQPLHRWHHCVSARGVFQQHGI